YYAPWFMALWGTLILVGFVVMIHHKLHQRPTLFLLHIAFIIILIGALLTHTTSKEGTLHLTNGEPPTCNFTTEDNIVSELPFAISLQQFNIDYYKGTDAPMDYISELKITKKDHTSQTITVSMNRVGKVNNYRIYQQGYDEDLNGTYLSISYDPIGRPLTLIGYLLLAITLIIITIKHFRTATIAVVLLLFSSNLQAQRCVDNDVATEMGTLMVLHQGRIMPLQTLARQFTIKECGKDTYHHMSAEQVFCSVLFFPDEWLKTPFIKIKSKSTKELLNKKSKFYSPRDFYDKQGNYLLHTPLKNDYKAHCAADEQLHLIESHLNGELLKIFPHQHSKDVVWYSPASALPSDIDNDEWLFIRHTFNLIGENINKGDKETAIYLIKKIKKYQQQQALESLPSNASIRAERAYNKLTSKIFGMIYTTIGLLLLLSIMACESNKQWANVAKQLQRVTLLFLVVGVVYLLVLFILRWITAHHIPLASGYETMQCLAILSACLGLWFNRKQPLLSAAALTTTGTSAMVSSFGEHSPAITNLVPVLTSPLLSLHVTLVMTAYALLAIVAINGLMVCIKQTINPNNTFTNNATKTSKLLLLPAVSFLCLGIFTGAVWADISWGRYWGWDPKETWALITLLIYSMPLHPTIFKTIAFHIFCLLAFLCVIITYFGVNFLLGGRHSYA
ncbi:MAG: cytochrome c biogenesis protein CcsA, partial [Bacteroidales bacterium]|nr:cytochrome c biogenesis protein CcsA [Bacteroidales bacterium]